MSKPLTRRQRLHLASNVAAGAEYLDTHADTGWPVVIAALLPTIKMSQGTSCIVGTLLRTDFLNGIASAFSESCYQDWVKTHGVPDHRLGFNVPEEMDEQEEDDELAPTDVDWRGAKQEPVWSTLLEFWADEADSRLTPELLRLVEEQTQEKLQAVWARGDELSEVNFKLEQAHAEIQGIEVRLEELRAERNDLEQERDEQHGVRQGKLNDLLQGIDKLKVRYHTPMPGLHNAY